MSLSRTAKPPVAAEILPTAGLAAPPPAPESPPTPGHPDRPPTSAAPPGADLPAGYFERFSGIGRLYGVPAMRRLQGAHVAVVGIGGVGTWAVEALARSGVGQLTLIDLDDICVTNVNRQLHALEGEIGRLKVDSMRERVLAIQPSCEVTAVADYLTEANAQALLARGFDVVVDAIDSPRHKCALLIAAREGGTPVVVVGGAGGRRDPTQILTGDMTESTNDALLRTTRKRLRQRCGWSRTGVWGVPCVWSRERAWYPTPEGGVCRQSRQEQLRLDCASGYGTASFVTGTMGFAAAGLAIDVLLAQERAPADLIIAEG